MSAPSARSSPRLDGAPSASAVPAWVDRAAYPWEPRDFATSDGTLRYLDVGRGPTVVLVHGTPTWSFLYRALIARLVASHRVIAVDHLGFGLSDKPPDAPYRPEDHARRLAALLDAVAPGALSLVVHDFGGPIGLSWAIRHPARVRRLALFNTWCWSLTDDPRVARVSRLADWAVGRFLYRRLNASPRWLLPLVVGDRRRLSPAAHAQYVRPFPDAPSREAPLALARALAGSSDWYAAQWAQRERLAAIPMLLAWGLRDPTFGPGALARWRDAFPGAEVAAFPECGHLVPEEAPAAAGERVAAFLGAG
jgi:haloalkane dehalogenase